MDEIRDSLSKFTGQMIEMGDEVIFYKSVTFQELIEQPISEFPISDTTPSVLNATRFVTKNSVITPTSITNFKYGQYGQEIRIRGDGFTTLVDGTYIKTKAGINLLLLANRSYTFTLWNDNVWIED